VHTISVNHASRARAITSTRHHGLATPRVNIQKARNGKAKAYQVKQVLAAIKKLNEQQKKRKEQRKEKGDD
jgi:hypothetical protein